MSLQAEHRALQALTFTALGRAQEADEQARQALELSAGVEMRGLLAAGLAVSGARDDDPSRTLAAAEEVIGLGTANALVLAWRACFDVARILLSSRPHRELVTPLLLEANDTSIAKRLGVAVPRDAQPAGKLSPREVEVCELLAQGLTNEEIAKVLFISLSTTKVHVRHIFEKLGVKSRVEAAQAWHELCST